MTLQELDDLTEWTYIEIHDYTSPWMQLAQLARNEGLLSVLPYALYRCIQLYSATMLLGGISKDDGTVQRLAPEDQLPCLEGHRRLIKAQTGTSFSWIYDDDTLSGSCTRPKKCDQFRHSLLKANLIPEPVVSGLDLWNATHADGLCKSCTEVAQVLQGMGRDQFWEMLPKLLDLPSWSELKKERENSYVIILTNFLLLRSEHMYFCRE